MKAIFRHIFTLGVKEIIAIFRDPLLLFLIIYCFTFSVYTGAKASPDAIDHAAIAIVDEDGSPLTKRLSDCFVPPLFQTPVRISRVDIDPMMNTGHFTFVIVFPPNFQERVLANHRPEIQVNVDATRMSQAFSGNSYIQQILVKEINSFVQEQTKTVNPYTAEALIRHRFNPNLTKSWEGAVNEMVNNIVMIALILTGAALIRERERGTLEHLMVTPIHTFEIMVSKVWSMSLIVWVASGLSLILIVNKALEIPIAGSVGLFMLGVALALFAMTSMGIFLACFSRDMPQLGILTILVLMPMQILSGGTTPLENMPKTIQAVMQFAPTTCCVKFSEAILFRGAEFELIWPVFLHLFLLGCLYFAVALMRFRKTVTN